MFGFMVNADGGLTTAGYVITVIVGIILFFLAIYFAGKNSDKKKLTTRQLVLWLGLLTESCSLSRSLIYFHFFRYAVITYLHLRHLDWQDYLQNRVMDF